MSYNRKLEDARHHHARAVRNADEAHCQANQTGRAADRQAYMEAMREVEERAEELATAESEVTV